MSFRDDCPLARMGYKTHERRCARKDSLNCRDDMFTQRVYTQTLRHLEIGGTEAPHSSEIEYTCKKQVCGVGCCLETKPSITHHT
jgi:hypothetical protein